MTGSLITIFSVFRYPVPPLFCSCSLAFYLLGFCILLLTYFNSESTFQTAKAEYLQINFYNTRLSLNAYSFIVYETTIKVHLSYTKTKQIFKNYFLFIYFLFLVLGHF